MIYLTHQTLVGLYSCDVKKLKTLGFLILTVWFGAHILLIGKCFAFLTETQAALLMVMLLVTLVLFIVAMILSSSTNLTLKSFTVFNSSRPSFPICNVC